HHGVNINAVDPEDRTALNWAACNGHTKIVRFLLSRGANANTKDVFGITPLMSAALRNWPAAARILIARGADINARADNTRISLYKGVFEGDRAAEHNLGLALKSGTRHEDGMTALQIARAQRNAEIVDVLIRAGAHE